MRKNRTIFIKATECIFFAVVFLLILFPFVFAFLILTTNRQVHYLYSQDIDRFYANNNEGLTKLFLTLFDEAQACELVNSPEQCQVETQKKLYKYITDQTAFGSTFSATYFIRLNEISADNQGTSKVIDKLFLSGKFEQESIDTESEMKVKDLLEGKKRKLIDFHINEDQTNMRYLRDFPADIEVIIPFRYEGKIVGAIVRLYGD